jgi:hypothetical protein
MPGSPTGRRPSASSPARCPAAWNSSASTTAAPSSRPGASGSARPRPGSLNASSLPAPNRAAGMRRTGARGRSPADGLPVHPPRQPGERGDGRGAVYGVGVGRHGRLAEESCYGPVATLAGLPHAIRVTVMHARSPLAPPLSRGGRGNLGAGASFHRVRAGRPLGALDGSQGKNVLDAGQSVCYIPLPLCGAVAEGGGHFGVFRPPAVLLSACPMLGWLHCPRGETMSVPPFTASSTVWRRFTRKETTGVREH